MNIIDTTIDMWKFNRDRTLATIKSISELPDPQAALGFRPGPGRAHLAWQLMHIAITEQLFATERLVGTPPQYAELVPRFRGGSTPDEDIPSLELIQEVLDHSRKALLSTIATYNDSDLETIPAAFKERGGRLGTLIKIISWHEAHHQGQAHLTLNMYKAAHQ